MSKTGVLFVLVFVALVVLKASGRWPKFGAAVLDATLLTLGIFITIITICDGL